MPKDLLVHRTVSLRNGTSREWRAEKRSLRQRGTKTRMKTKKKGIVSLANEIVDPLEEIQKMGYKINCKENLTFHCYKRRNLPDEIFKWAVSLVERNMKAHYENSSWNWDAEEKSQEMAEDSAYYLILSDKYEEILIGFCHFRFDLDYGHPVLYCYELQIEQPFRNQGFGAMFINLLIEFARLTQMVKIVATVFKHNELSCNFFRKNNFELDDTSPNESMKADYLIFSQILQ